MKIESVVAPAFYDQAKKALDTQAGAEDAGANFSKALGAALPEMHRTVQAGEAASTAALSGTGDTQALVEALTATEMALETAVVVRDRVVEAYQEVLRMPV